MTEILLQQGYDVVINLVMHRRRRKMCITKKVADSLSYPQKQELLQWNEAGEKWEDENPFSITEMDTADYMKKKEKIV